MTLTLKSAAGMKLGDVTGGSVYVDTNVLYMCLHVDPTNAIAIHGKAIEKAIRDLIGLPHMNLAGVDIADANRMLDHITRFSMLPRDALHVAIIQRLGLTAVASDDTDFDRVEGLERHWVINPPAAN
jgi:hypothetical protein